MFVVVVTVVDTEGAVTVVDADDAITVVLLLLAVFCEQDLEKWPSFLLCQHCGFLPSTTDPLTRPLLRPSATVGLKCRKARTTMRTGSKAGDWRIFEP